MTNIVTFSPHFGASSRTNSFKNPVITKFFHFSISLFISFFLLAGTILLSAEAVYAWPADSQWIPIPKGGTDIQDDHLSGAKNGDNDATGSVNIVPYSGTLPAAYTYNDGSYLHFRLRIDQDPSGTGGQGILQSFGWGVEFDTDQNADNYEWLIMCDGIASPEVVSLQQNTIQESIGDPSDGAEVWIEDWPLPGNHRIIAAGSATNGDADYFLDFRIPYPFFSSATGITDDTLVRYFIGSSRSAQNSLTTDLLGGSDLYGMASDYITPFGSAPSVTGITTYFDGAVNFVEDIGGFGQVTLAAPGDILYLRVDDADLNSFSNPTGTVRVDLTAPSGDFESITLTATGVAGKYTGSITTANAAATSNDDTLQVTPDEIITATYYEAISANFSQNVPRVDNILITLAALDIGVNKTVDNPIPQEGDTVTFSVSATNFGPATANSVLVSDKLPSGMTLVSATATQGIYDDIDTWDIGTLTRFASATLTLIATINTNTNGQTLTNTAKLTNSTPTDANPDNDIASAEVFIGGTDLRVTKTADTLYPLPNTDVTFSVRVFNLGPNDTDNVRVEDQLPAGLIYKSHSASAGNYDPASGFWDINTLTTGNGAALNLTATTAGNLADTIINEAKLLSSDQPDTDPSNDSESITLLLGGLDIEVDKTVDNPAPASASSINYTLTATNAGPNQATGLQLIDILPTEVAFTGASGTGTYDPATGIWDIGILDGGGIATLQISADVQTGFAGATVINTATLTAVDQPDITLNNNSAIALIRIDGTDLSLSKSVNAPTPTVGQPITFRIDLVNNGPVDATNINVTDLLPDGLSYVGTGNNIDYRTSQGTYDNNSGVWDVGDLTLATASAWLEIDATVDTGTSGTTITNIAFITKVDQEDPVAADNFAAASIAVDGIDLTLAKTVSNATPNVDEIITYSLTIDNNGLNQATNVEVTDLLPPEVDYISESSGGNYDPATGIWTVGSVDPGVPQTLIITVQVRNEDNNLTISNNAAISNADQSDPDISNNFDSADITISASDVAISKTVNNPTPAVGSTVIYTVTASNLGSNAVTSAEVQDILPAGITLINATPSQGTYTAGAWFIGTLAGSTSATLTISASVNPFTAGTTITNTATLFGLDQIDTDQSNNLASENIIPVAAPNLTILKAASSANAQPGDTITYTVIVANTGTSFASDVVLDDVMQNSFIALGIDPYVNGTPFSYTDPIPFSDSGLTVDTIIFEDENGNPITLTDGAGGAPAGSDGRVAKWEISFSGVLPATKSFTLIYQVTIK